MPLAVFRRVHCATATAVFKLTIDALALACTVPVAVPILYTIDERAHSGWQHYAARSSLVTRDAVLVACVQRVAARAGP